MKQIWYVKMPSGEIQGPFLEERMWRYQAEGRFEKGMLVSCDQVSWLPALECGFGPVPTLSAGSHLPDGEPSSASSAQAARVSDSTAGTESWIRWNRTMNVVITSIVVLAAVGTAAANTVPGFEIATLYAAQALPHCLGVLIYARVRARYSRHHDRHVWVAWLATWAVISADMHYGVMSWLERAGNNEGTWLAFPFFFYEICRVIAEALVPLPTAVADSEGR